MADRTEFWWNERKPDESSLWESKIRIGEDLFNEIISHPVPLDMNILKALKRCALGLDLYLWLTYRTFTLRDPQRLTWRQLYRQFDANPVQAPDKRAIQNFRIKILRELKKIKTGLAAVELRDGSGHPDPASLNPGNPSSTRTTAPREIAIPCPSAACQRPFCGGLVLWVPPAILNRQKQ